MRGIWLADAVSFSTKIALHEVSYLKNWRKPCTSQDSLSCSRSSNLARSKHTAEALRTEAPWFALERYKRMIWTCACRHRLCSCFWQCPPWAGRSYQPSHRVIALSTTCSKTTALISLGMTLEKARARLSVPTRAMRCRASTPTWTAQGRGSASPTQPESPGSCRGWRREGQGLVEWAVRVSSYSKLLLSQCIGNECKQCRAWSLTTFKSLSTMYKLIRSLFRSLFYIIIARLFIVSGRIIVEK